MKTSIPTEAAIATSRAAALRQEIEEITQRLNLLQAGLSGLTRTGSAMGKPYFMPRQQVVNFKYSKPEVDVWALATCLYWLLTGAYPRDFPPAKDPWKVVLQDAPVPARARNPAVPGRLAETLDQALRERPAIGFTTAADLRHALERT
jgi:serine/threonine-protein kinase